MQNPWLGLDPHGTSYILDADYKEIEHHNGRVVDSANKVIVQSIPEPFIGNPKLAKVVLLGLNPGHSPDDGDTYRGNADLRSAMFRNLRHEAQEYPFYPLNPAFRETGAGRWWRKRTRHLREESGLDDCALADRLMVIEWFPYHSLSFAIPKKRCASQAYSFHLAQEMLQGGKFIILMRAKKLWSEVDSRFADVQSLKNPQCSYISRGNAGDWFPQMVKALTSSP